MSRESVYPRAPEFARRAHVQGLESYRELYRQAEEHPEEFWGGSPSGSCSGSRSSRTCWSGTALREVVHGGKTNSRTTARPAPGDAARRQDRHPVEGEPGDQLRSATGNCPPAVSRLPTLSIPWPQGWRPRVVYMPMVPEAAVAMLVLPRARRHAQRGIRRFFRRRP